MRFDISAVKMSHTLEIKKSQTLKSKIGHPKSYQKREQVYTTSKQLTSFEDRLSNNCQ